MLKKKLALLLSTALVISAITGCSTSTTETTSASTESEESVAESTEEEVEEVEKEIVPCTITMLYSEAAAAPYNSEWAVFDWIEEATGVTLEITAVPESDYTSKRSLVFNSGDIPDIVCKTFVESSYVSSGILLPISDYEDMLPNFQAFIEEYGHGDYLDSTRFSDGNYYGLPIKIRDSVFQDKQWFIREDIFELNNLPIPTTLEELFDVAVELKEIYPDSTPIANLYGTSNYMFQMALGYGTCPSGMFYNYDTETWEFAATTDGWKEMIEFTTKCYEAGVLDQEFTTLDATTFEQRVVSGDIFIMNQWVGGVSRYNTTGQELNPDFQLSMIYPLEGSDGNYALQWKSPTDQMWVFPASLADDEEHLAEVLAFVDWGYTEEAEILLTFGVEGETFEITEDGTYQFIDSSLNYTELYGLNDNNLCIRQHLDVLTTQFTEADMVIMEQVMADNIVPTPNPQAPLDSDQLEAVQVMTTTLTDYTNQCMEKFIFGELSIEDDWDDFIAECIAKGSEELEAVYAEAAAAAN